MDFACNATISRGSTESLQCREHARTCVTLLSRVRSSERFDRISEKRGRKRKERKKRYIDSVSMFQCSIARFFSTRDSRDSMHGSYVTRRTTRNAKLSRFEMTKRDRGRDVIISLLSLYIARIDASSVNRFVGKSPLESVRLLRAKRWRKTNIYVATIYASNYFSRDSRRTENRR